MALGGSASSSSSSSEDAKVSAAAKIQAARSLARKLSDERSAAAAAAELLERHLVNGETSRKMKSDVENEVAAFAKEAGRKDSEAREAKRTGAGAGVDMEELERLKRENAELQALLLQLARDREEAEKELEARMKELNVVNAETIRGDARGGDLRRNRSRRLGAGRKPTRHPEEDQKAGGVA